MHPLTVESTIHVREKIKNWNISVQLWLQRCVYYRYRSAEQYKTDKKAMAEGQLVVFAVSAFWHGFYGGYYISFFLWYQMMTLAYLIFRITQNKQELISMYDHSGVAGHIAVWAVVNCMFSYFGAEFQIMSMGACYRFMASTYFLPYILLFALVFGLQRSPLVRGSKTDKTDRTDKTAKSQ